MDNTEYDDLSLADLAKLIKQAKEEKEAAAEAKADAEKYFDHLRLVVIPERLEKEGMSSVNIAGVGRLGVTTDLRVSVLAENREAVHQWLIENGHGDIVVDTVHSSTMKAFVKEQIEKGNELPHDLIKIDPFMRASLTKK